MAENHIIVGLGGTGGKVLRTFKMRMFEEFPSFDERQKQSVALLYVDTTREMMGIGRDDFNVMGQDASFTQNEFLFIKSSAVTDIIDNVENYPQLKGIVGNAAATRNAIGNLGEAAGQKRRAGRLLFAKNATEYVNALRDAFARCNQVSHNNSKIVHIIAGLCGGTGSGSIIDAIAQTRKLWPDAKILVYVMIPERDLPKSDMDKGRYYQNGYAALRELNALQTGQFKPHDVTGNGEPLDLFNPAIKGVANGITVYSNDNENGITVNSFEDLPKIVSDYIYARVFIIDPTTPGVADIIRAYNSENMDDFAYEFDEAYPVEDGVEMPIKRTKLVSSFGLKRVVYPEFRILKHIVYTTGVDVLEQTLYGNWVENVGYVDEEVNKDYRGTYLKEENLERWKLKLEYLSYDKKVLENDEPVDTFRDIWQRRVQDWSEDCKQYNCPLTELRNTIDKMFCTDFRDTQKSVVDYFKGKVQARKDIASEIRRSIEREIFELWKTGVISILELKRISETLYDYVNQSLQQELRKAISDNDKRKKELDETLNAILDDWRNVPILLRPLNRPKFYVEYQECLVNYFEACTNVEAYQFARQIHSSLDAEMLAMRDEIAQFCEFISKAIKSTKELVAAQRKKNPGLEDMRGAEIEVSEEGGIIRFEEKMRIDKQVIDTMSASLRRDIIGEAPFSSFARLMQGKSTQSIRAAFDTTIAEQVKERHNELPKTETKVLGLSVLSQLQQKLDDNKKINEFAHDILQQSGVYINLDKNQMTMSLDNNPLPQEGTNVNMSEIFVCLPKPESKELEEFAKELAIAFKNQAPQGIKAPTVYTESTRKNEIFIVTIKYGFPMRSISWLADYKKRYENLLNQRDDNSNRTNRILLHSEGTGETLPSIYALPADTARCRKEEIRQQLQAQRQPQQQPYGQPQQQPYGQPQQQPYGQPQQQPYGQPQQQPYGQPQTMNQGPVPPPPPQPVVSLHLYVNGVTEGPYDWNTCQQKVAYGQLTKDTLVWENGMAGWTPAGQVAKLQLLFAPAPPPPPMPNMPPTPPTPPVPPMP